MNNIIECKLDSRYASTLRAWQYDYGQVLRISGRELPPAVEVQFALDDKSGETLTRVGTTVEGVTEVKIPDELLAHSAIGKYRIYAYIYLTDETSGNTKYEITIPVEPRPKPTSPTEDPEVDPDPFRDAVVAVNESADRAETAEKSAKESAEKAENTLAEIKEAGDSLSNHIEQAEELDGNLEQKIEQGEGIVEHIKDKLDTPPNPLVGKYLRVKAVNDEGIPELEWVEAPSGGSDLDVRINGESIVEDGVATVPYASTNGFGVTSIFDGYGLEIMSNKMLLKQVSTSDIDKRHNRSFDAVNVVNLDYAVKSAMSAPIADVAGMVDGVYHYPAWTAEEQANARERMGIYDWEDVITYTTSDEEENSTVCYIDFEHVYKKIHVLIDESAIEGTTYMSVRFGVIGKNKLHNVSLLTNTNPAFSIKTKYKSFQAEVMNTTDVSYKYIAASSVQLLSYCDYPFIGQVGPPSKTEVDTSAIGGLVWYGKMYAGTVITVIGVRA